jgi:hypothetical protein
LRYFGGALAFGFAAVWIMWSLTAALICLLSAAAGYGAVVVAERARAKLAARAGSPSISPPSTSSRPTRTPAAEDLSLQADELNHDLGHVYEPTPAMRPRAADGSPRNDEAAAPGETTIKASSLSDQSI